MNKTELQKCKEDIVYFAEKYLEPPLQLSDFKKELLRGIQKGYVLTIERRRGGKQFLIMEDKKENNGK